jgi:beta-phosphoglucomutase
MEGEIVPPRAVLWDLDGTLVDSADYHFESWVEALRPEGVALTREQFMATFGQRNDRILARWLGLSVPADRARRIADEKERLYREYVRTRGLEPLPGADPWVRRLHRAGWKQAVASSAPRLNIEQVIDVLGWRSLFEAIVSADEVRAGKPDPGVFLAAASRLRVPPEACVVVEDAPAGVEAARRGRMRSVGVGAGVADSGADLTAPSLDRLPEDAFDRLVGA